MSSSTDTPDNPHQAAPSSTSTDSSSHTGAVNPRRTRPEIDPELDGQAAAIAANTYADSETLTFESDDAEDLKIPGDDKEKGGRANGLAPEPYIMVEESSYPSLNAIAETNTHLHEASSWKIAGIRFAPLKVPFIRRMQTTAVLFHCLSIVLITSFFFFVCAIPLSWPLLIPYLIHVLTSTAATDGRLAHRSEYLRSLPLWKLFGGYFPARLYKTHELPSSRKYILGYHPHGIISHGAWVCFTTNALGFGEKFPGITNTLVTLDSNFRLPLYRDYLLAMGLRSVSKESIWNTLTRGGADGEGMGRAITIVIGGARESLEAQPGTLRLIIGRKGFVRMALKTGADLVPVLAFGENDLYDQLSPKAHPWVHRFQIFVLKVFKFTLPALSGRGILNYDVGLMPYRKPLNIVVGKPIKVERVPQPEQEQIDRLHELYVAELQKVWHAYKDDFAKDRRDELQFIA